MYLYLCLFLISSALCINLQRCLNDKQSTAEIVPRNHSRYNEVNFQVITRKVIHPEGYVLVNSAEDVKKAIECGKELNIHYAIQSGGHSFEKYSYGTNGSWIISVAFLKKIEFDEMSKTVRVGSGHHLGELVQDLWKTCKCAVPVGNCCSVGVGGFALGGGYGLSSRKHGTLSDNIVEIEIITADAQIRRVNERTNSDLFWALRGAGGGNFGVVTEFTFKTFDASHTYIWIRKKISYDKFEIFFKQWHNWLSSNISSSVGCNILGSIFNLTFWLTIDNIDYVESERQLLVIRDYITCITEDDVGRGTFIEYYDALSLNDWSLNKRRIYYKAKNFFVSKLLTEREIDFFINFLKTNTFLLFDIDVYGGMINQVMRNKTAFVHRNALYNIQLSISYRMDENLTNYTAFDHHGEQMKKKLNYVSNYLSFMDNGESYQNYVDDEMIDWFFRFYRENGERLRRIKRKYDHCDFFRFNQSIKPLFI